MLRVHLIEYTHRFDAQCFCVFYVIILVDTCDVFIHSLQGCLPSNLQYKPHQIPKNKCFSSRRAVRCLDPIHWTQMLSSEWRYNCTDRRCSNYIWVINNFIAYWGETCIRALKAIGIEMIVRLSRRQWSENRKTQKRTDILICTRHGGTHFARDHNVSKKGVIIKSFGKILC